MLLPPTGWPETVPARGHTTGNDEPIQGAPCDGGRSVAAWERAKHVVGGSQVVAPASTPEVPAVPTGPVTGEVKPAA
jgi:hypothetical protein